METIRFRLGWWSYSLVIAFWLLSIALMVWLIQPMSASDYSHKRAGILLITIMLMSPSLILTWSLITERTTVFSSSGFSRFMGLRRKDVKWREISSVRMGSFDISLSSPSGKCRIALMNYKHPAELAKFVRQHTEHTVTSHT